MGAAMNCTPLGFSRALLTVGALLVALAIAAATMAKAEDDRMGRRDSGMEHRSGGTGRSIGTGIGIGIGIMQGLSSVPAAESGGSTARARKDGSSGRRAAKKGGKGGKEGGGKGGKEKKPATPETTPDVTGV